MGSGCFSGGKAGDEMGTLSEPFTVGCQHSTMELCDAAGQTQSNTQPALNRVGGTGRLGEQLKDVGQCLLVHADAGVADIHYDMRFQLRHAQSDAAALVGVL